MKKLPFILVALVCWQCQPKAITPANDLIESKKTAWLFIK
jgi:hypothetical protein